MLRPASPADIPLIQSVLNKPENLTKLEGYPDQAIQSALNSKDAQVWIWQEDESWQGFCWLSYSEAGTKIEEFGVSTPGGGVGTKLFTAVIEHFNANGAATPLWLLVAADNSDAIRFYERFGFVHSELRKSVWKRREGPIADAVKMTYAPGVDP